jgi:circadian clock protein KaiB
VDSKHRILLTLYVAGQTPSCSKSIEMLRHACDVQYEGRCQVAVVDFLDQPWIASDVRMLVRVLAMPTLVDALPPSLRAILDDLVLREEVLIGADILPVPEPSGA